MKTIRVAVALMLALAASARAQQPPASSDAKAIADFDARLKNYVALHQKLESTLPALPKQAGPERVAEHRRRLAGLIVTGRPKATVGELFAPDIRAVIRRVLARVLGGPQGKSLKSAIMDENPPGLTLKVNMLYPEDRPLATMPPEVLKDLPKLPEELDYRFVGDDLILLDTHAHVIVDFIPGAMPR
ncbi:MAG TPA: hypothetical protein VFO19_13530 [Vicinamibacterales bacterium]|nr:hypothetical protein [Vicinamibacterales bacterium]